MKARLLHCLCLTCSIFAIPLSGSGIALAEEPATSAVASYYEQILREKRIEPTAEGLLRYFKALHPDEAYRQRVAQLMRDLGSTESFAKREQAMAQLLALPRPPREALTSAASGSDPEVRWRSERILETAIAESERVLYAALRVCEEKKPPGLTVELIRAVPLCNKPHLVYAVGEAMQAVARAGDAGALRDALLSENVELRAANGNVLIASYTLSKVIQVDPAKKVVWEYACSIPLNAKALTNGNILIAEHGAQRVVEVTSHKKVVWTYACGGSPTDVHRLENGNTLVSVAGGGGVREVTPEGKTVWYFSTGNVNVYGCQPLPSGNVLIADLKGEVLEVTRDKKVVWQFAFSAVDCFRLPNGNTLITGHIQFMEVTPDKKIIWSKDFYGYGSARR